jgi:Carboxypeptidase regulatory-like domain
VNCSRSLALRPQAGHVLLSVLILVLGTVSWGCGGVVSGPSGQTPPPPPPTTYSISGTISPAAGGNGATVTLSGAASATVTANSAGAYSFAGLANGTYMVTPSQAGYNFTPSNQSVTVNGANVNGINFTATAQNSTFNISGTITPAAGGSGATVTLSGAGTATTTADSSGAYTFTGLANGTYAVTPSKAGYTFSPASQNATVNGANVTGINFTATAQTNTFSISGTITPTAGGSGATVMLSGPAAATSTADTSGNYSFTGLANGTYTVTPSNTGFTFSPASESVTVNGANQTGVNFTATPQQSHTVALSWTASTTTTVTGYNVYRSTTNGSGYVKINSSLVTVLTYTDSTVLNGTTYYYVTTAVDSTGAESGYSNQATAVVP